MSASRFCRQAIHNGLTIAVGFDGDQLVIRVEDGDGYDLIADVEAGPSRIVARAICSALSRAIVEDDGERAKGVERG